MNTNKTEVSEGERFKRGDDRMNDEKNNTGIQAGKQGGDEGSVRLIK